MRPHDDVMTMWLHEIRLEYLLLQLFAQKMIIFLVFYESVTDGRTDRRTDGPTLL